MSLNLLGLVKDQLTSAAVSKIGGFLGESSQNTSSALGSLLPTLLGGVMDKASTADGAASVMDMLKKTDHESILGGLSNSLESKNGLESLIGSGSGILSGIFGNKLGSLVNILSGSTGMGSSSTSSLLSIAAPILMSVLGRSSSGMGISGLTNLLMGQKDLVKAALPSGLDNIFNVNSIGDYKGDTTHHQNETHTRTVKEEVEERPGGFNFWPWLLLALLGLGALYFWKSCSAQPAADAVKEEVKVAVDSTKSKLDSVASAVKRTLSTGVNLTFGEKSIENELISFIEDKSKAVDKTTWFNFRDLKFETASAKLDASSLKEVDNISEIMKAYPTVNLKVGGYTDSEGDDKSNMKLSADRANNVMAALVAKGIDKARIAAEGYGEQHPIGDNATPEGRAANRRIAVRVTQK